MLYIYICIYFLNMLCIYNIFVYAVCKTLSVLFYHVF